MFHAYGGAFRWECTWRSTCVSFQSQPVFGRRSRVVVSGWFVVRDGLSIGWRDSLLQGKDACLCCAKLAPTGWILFSKTGDAYGPVGKRLQVYRNYS